MDCYRITVPSYHLDLCKNLHQLQQKQYYCDTTLQCNDGILVVHKLILLSCGSQYFNRYFSERELSNRSDGMMCSITLRDFSCQVVNILIQGIYTGEMYIIQNLKDDIISLCRFLELNSFVTAIENVNSNENETFDLDIGFMSKTGPEDTDEISDGENMITTVESQNTKPCKQKTTTSRKSEDSFDEIPANSNSSCKKLNVAFSRTKQNKGVKTSGNLKRKKRLDKTKSSLLKQANQGNVLNEEIEQLPENDIFSSSCQIDDGNCIKMKISKHGGDTDNTNLKEEIMEQEMDEDGEENDSEAKGTKNGIKRKSSTEHTDLAIKNITDNDELASGSSSESTIVRSIIQNLSINQIKVEVAESTNNASIQNDTTNNTEAFSCKLCHYVTISNEEMEKHLLEKHEEKTEDTQQVFPMNEEGHIHFLDGSYNDVSVKEEIQNISSQSEVQQFVPGPTIQNETLVNSKEMSVMYIEHTTHNNDPNFIKCSTGSCNQVFDMEDLKKDHVSKYHGSQHSCDQCGKKYRWKKNLKDHMKSHDNLFNFECDICHKTFMQEHAYEGHMNQHNNFKPYKCFVCEASYAYRSSYTRHMLKSHKHKTDKSYECNECTQTFNSGDSLKNHKEAKHLNRIFECSVCCKGFKYRSGLSKHRRKQCHEMK